MATLAVFQLYHGVGIDRFLAYSGYFNRYFLHCDYLKFVLCRIPIYSGFGLDRFHYCISWYECLNIQPNSVRGRFWDDIVFVLSSAGFEITPLVHCSTNLLGIMMNHLASSAKSTNICTYSRELFSSGKKCLSRVAVHCQQIKNGSLRKEV